MIFRKEAGFTLIEFMIVLAVIGILAAVLMPIIGGSKTAAKNAGIDANIRRVQALAHGRITIWSYNYDLISIGAEIKAEFDDSARDPLINPINGTTTDAMVVGALPAALDDRTPGTIYISLPDDATTLISNGLVIWGVDNNLNVYNSITIRP